MNASRLSFSNSHRFVFAAILAVSGVQATTAQEASSFLYTDPATGIQYRKEYETLERPMIRQASESREVATMQAKVVRQWEMVPATQYVAVQREVWHPQWRGGWNPLTPSTLYFKPKAEIVWEARPVMTPQSKAYTQWVEHRETVEIPKNYASIHREQIERWVAVGPVEANHAARLAEASRQNAVGTYPGDGRQVPQVASVNRISGSLPATVLAPASQNTPQRSQPIPQATVFR